jgi:arylformamidase
MKVFDLSHTIHEEMPLYPGTKLINIKQLATVSEQGYNEKQFTITSHIGTHIDAPAHMLEQGKRLDELPIDTFCAYANIIDVSAYQGRQIDEHVLMNSGLQFKNIEYIIFYTGYEQYWGQEKYFKDFPVLTSEAAQWLCNKNLKGIGLDACSVDPVGSQDLPIHHILFNSGLTIVENLTNLKKLIGTRFLFSCLPLKIKDADGSPVRAAAMLDYDLK